MDIIQLLYVHAKYKGWKGCRGTDIMQSLYLRWEINELNDGNYRYMKYKVYHLYAIA